jgi:predicted regulator of Ras-like GTPase activity (Roadblock/LC7/MglB family)
MDAILQGLLALDGVNAALVMDDQGQVLGHLGRAIYDEATLGEAAALVAKAVDSIQLQQEDWELVTAQFADGLLLVRNVGPVHDAGNCLLVIVADATLNLPFATVAVRVAVNKLKRPADAGHGSSSGVHGTRLGNSSVQPPPPSARLAPLPPPVRAAPPHSAPPSLTPDPASLALLTRCTRELALCVGPMARVMVDEAVRRVCLGQPFSLAAMPALLDELSNQIEDPQGRATFLTAVRLSKPR